MKTSKEHAVRKILDEAFVNRKFTPGTIKFSKSSLEDPHIKTILNEISKQTGTPLSHLIADVIAKIHKFTPIAETAPTLYATIKNNIVEDTTFKLLEKYDVKTDAPRFDVTTFYKLMRYIRADHDEFFPLRSFIDLKHLYAPKILIIGEEHKTPPGYEQVTTAAASPDGEFIFNAKFMQKLLDFAHLKQVKPKGKKYVSNHGDIPDEYCYIEFIIMHEFMHYTNDDFHYQKIIPSANDDIINWVGDFRTNYLLVKSGYEQLPMGLFNDHINYDRQKTYIEMYNIVKSEFDKLDEQQRKLVSNKLDEMSDDHRPGQEQGKQSDIGKNGKDATGKPIDPSKIDDKAEQTESQMEGSDDKGPTEAGKPTQQPTKQPGKGGRGGQGADIAQAIDYTKIKPRFNWSTLIKMFVKTSSPKIEETYQRPSRRNVSNIYTAQQTGAGAIKPSEVKLQYSDIGLGFVVDSSGSMSEVIEKVYANIHVLLRMPAFSKSLFTLIKFSNTHHIYKCNFTKDIAAEIPTVDKKPETFNLKVSTLFNQHFGSSTNFTNAVATQILTLLKQKVNILLLSDSDILASGNINELLGLLNTHPKQIFIIFDTRETYITFRQQTKATTQNITYFE